MPQISAGELQRLPLRAHDFLAGVPLHDVWAVDLPRWRAGITLDAFLRAANDRPFSPSPAVRALLAVRFFVGRLLGWDRVRPASAGRESLATRHESLAHRLTEADRARSLVAPGTPQGPFRLVYRFEGEQLVELVNRTVHAGALSALVETADGYRFYFAVYVQRVGRLTPLYMAAIDPVRRLVVYPSLLRSVRATWDRAFGPARD